MLDRFGRKINYLRISVTDRCNQRCYYCMPKDGITLIKHEEVLSYEEILRITTEFVEMGIDKVRLTGGEPLVRRGIVSLVAMLSGIEGIKDLSMTTNGVLLAEYAEDLKKNGLNRINVSLDSINPEIYKQVTNTDKLDDVFKGLRASKNVGFNPIKINCVVKKSRKEKDAQEVTEFAYKNGFDIRFIRMMNIVKGEFWPVIGGNGGNCKKCNRLRLSSDGRLFPCLFSDVSFSVKKLGAEKALRLALNHKPKSGKAANNKFYGLGG
jgi:GTP 3',8-cyclase